MFFIGVSAHLFIYLLIPAFLIVSFYCRDIQGCPEVQTPLPVITVYEQAPASLSSDTYVYQADSRKKVRTGIKSFTFLDIPFRLPGIFPPARIHTDYILSWSILRAPPVLRP